MDYEPRPTTHKNNGDEDQPVDVKTQRFSKKPDTVDSVREKIPPTVPSLGNLRINDKAAFKPAFLNAFKMGKDKEAEYQAHKGERYADYDYLSDQGTVTLRNFKQNREEKIESGAFKPLTRSQREIMRSPECVEHIENIIRQSSLCCRCGFEYLENVLTDQLKNQFQFGDEWHTGGSSNKAARARQSSFSFGTEIGDDPAVFFEHHEYGETFEKYGSLLGNDKLKRFSGDQTDRAIQYGDSLIEMKPGMKRRTTYCLGDSLSSDALPQLINGRFDPYTRAWASNEWSDPYYVMNATNAKELSRCLGVDTYIELQFHGKVTADDIDNITASASNWNTERGKKVAKLCKEKGIRMFSVKRNRLSGADATIMEVDVDDYGNVIFKEYEE